MAVLSFLDRDRSIAHAGYSRWLVPPAALAIHLCIGQAYAFSVFKIPLTQVLGITKSVPGDWTQPQFAWIFSLAIVILGLSAATFGKWLEGAGPRKAMFASAVCFALGFFVSYFGVIWHQLWMIYCGYGVIGGIGLGLGYISPVSTLIKWFPDRPGLATGMAIMGFGGGAMIGSPISNQADGVFPYLERHWSREDLPGDGPSLLLVHDVRGVYHSRAAGRVEAGKLDARRQAASDDHNAQRRGEHGVWHAAVLVVVDRSVHERDSGHWNYRAGVADDSGVFQGRALDRWRRADSLGCLSLVQHGRPIFLVVRFGLYREEGRPTSSSSLSERCSISFLPQTGADHLNSVVSVCDHCGGVAKHVRRGIRDDSGVLARHVRYPSRERDPRRLLTAWSMAGVLGPVLVNYMREYEIAARSG